MPTSVFKMARLAGRRFTGTRPTGDESGEDYLYPAACFVVVDLPLAALGVFANVS